MIYSIAGFQFIFIAIGLLFVNVIVKVATASSDLTRLDYSLFHAGLYLFLIPAVWLTLANFLQNQSLVSDRTLRVSGYILTAVLLVLLGVPLVELYF